MVKERLLKEAEELSTSTDWGPTSSRYRTLMQDWKAAGAAPREVEEDLWQRFRAAQDTFFGAREAANAEQDREFAANAEKKKEILVEAEALLPVTDLEAAKRAFRDIADRWDAAGKVPRDQMKSLEARIRKVEQAIRSVEDDQWRKQRPREVRPRRRHARPARARHRRHRDQPRQGPRVRGREEGPRARGEPRLAPAVPRDGPEGRLDFS